MSLGAGLEQGLGGELDDDFDGLDELWGCACCVFADFGGAFDEFGGAFDVLGRGFGTGARRASPAIPLGMMSGWSSPWLRCCRAFSIERETCSHFVVVSDTKI